MLVPPKLPGQAVRTWAGVAAAGRMPADSGAGSQNEGSIAGSRPKLGSLVGQEFPAGEDDIDFDDLLAGLTGDAATHGELMLPSCQLETGCLSAWVCLLLWRMGYALTSRQGVFAAEDFGMQTGYNLQDSIGVRLLFLVC